MNDKDFLGYFKHLSAPKITEKAQGAQNIVQTLKSLDAIDSKSFGEVNSKVESLLKKYQSGDLGQISADLNYTLKRLISGLSSELSVHKQGYFLTLVLLLKAFDVDSKKLITYMLSETKDGKAMKRSEKHHFGSCRLLILSAVVEAGLDEEEWVSQVGKEFVELWRKHTGLRQSIVASVNKTLQKLSDGARVTMLQTVSSLFKLENINSLKTYIFSDSNSLALYLSLSLSARSISDLSREADLETLLDFSIFSDLEETVISLSTLLKSAKMTTQGPHLYISLLLKIIEQEEQTDIVPRLWSSICLDHCFDANVHEGVAQHERIGLLQSGFALCTELFRSELLTSELVLTILSPKFLKQLVINLQRNKKLLRSANGCLKAIEA